MKCPVCNTLLSSKPLIVSNLGVLYCSHECAIADAMRSGYNEESAKLLVRQCAEEINPKEIGL